MASLPSWSPVRRRAPAGTPELPEHLPVLVTPGQSPCAPDLVLLPQATEALSSRRPETKSSCPVLWAQCPELAGQGRDGTQPQNSPSLAGAERVHCPKQDR